MSDAQKLGSLIGSLVNEQESIKENLSGDDSETQEQVVFFETYGLSGNIIGYKKTYPEDSFILDHPVYGELDSAVLKLDGGYAGGFTFPATFPLTFGDTVVLFENNF